MPDMPREDVLCCTRPPAARGARKRPGRRREAMNLRNAAMAGVLAAATVAAVPSSADARPFGWGWGGVGLGLAAGAIIAGAALSAPAYGYYPAYSYGYG